MYKILEVRGAISNPAGIEPGTETEINLIHFKCGRIPRRTLGLEEIRIYNRKQEFVIGWIKN
jgi:hypothetical protein